MCSFLRYDGRCLLHAIVPGPSGTKWCMPEAQAQKWNDNQIYICNQHDNCTCSYYAGYGKHGFFHIMKYKEAPRATAKKAIEVAVELYSWQRRADTALLSIVQSTGWAGLTLPLPCRPRCSFSAFAETGLRCTGCHMRRPINTLG